MAPLMVSINFHTTDKLKPKLSAVAKRGKTFFMNME